MITLAINIRGAKSLLELAQATVKVTPDTVARDLVPYVKSWLEDGSLMYKLEIENYTNLRSPMSGFYGGIQSRTGYLWNNVLKPTEPAVVGNTISGSIIDPQAAQMSSVVKGMSKGGITYYGLLEMIEYGHAPWRRKRGKPIHFYSWKTGGWHTIQEHPGFSPSNAMHKAMAWLKEKMEDELPSAGQEVIFNLYQTFRAIWPTAMVPVTIAGRKIGFKSFYNLMRSRL